ncbi:hypothetical protein HYH03_005992 [Edaphochlamys debaryana]|uniref:ATP-dependent DNA helicase n=1 Tax=Edaphochlamys debaryana TaxID=47281 RepID=A0A835Y7B0_9CHLO|nr:hypothetical protein HYH03_005992 [Edaphochlamys debaryana]|eukprot:KAG2496073.1 hypothetical protein HYH03_005992 [Edaphochlamys debaryana]
MQLALVNAGAGFLANANGFFTMRLSQPQVLGGAVLNWNPLPAARGALLAAGLQEVLAWSIANNPIYSAFLSVAEQPNVDIGSPFLTADVVAGFVSQARARAPLICGQERTLAAELLSVMMPVAPPPSAYRAPPTLYGGGVLRWRQGGGTGNIIMLPDGSPSPNTARVPGSDHPITAEVALFPFLFPFGTAAYFGGPHTLVQYLNFRAYSFFSVYTLTKPYLMLMYTIRQTIMLYNKNNKAVLEKAVRAYLKSHPGASDAAILKHVIKYSLPANIPNTPGWHRKNLLDLLALVDRWGMPIIFLTVTADELSMTRWGEVAAMEEHLDKFCSSFTWKDAPAENAYLFHKRVWFFMDKVLRVGRGDSSARAASPLGRILHHVTRYEVQNRQSLHAHILLWIHPNDVERVSAEIIACVPAAYHGDVSNKTCPITEDIWDEPEDEPQRKLFRHVMSKQMHRCSPAKQPGCCKSGTYQYGFPWKPYNSPTPTVDPTCRRYVYFRPSWAHRNVSPYHPTVALLWGAHMNIQRITSTDWSFYVLEYALKAEPCGTLKLENLSHVALGLPEDPPAANGEPSYVVKLINAFLCSTVVSPTLAWLMCANINTVHMSSSVLAIDSSSRTRAVLPGARLQTPAVKVSMLRPVQLEGTTFTSFYMEYALVPVKPRTRRQRRRGQQPGQQPAQQPLQQRHSERPAGKGRRRAPSLAPPWTGTLTSSASPSPASCASAIRTRRRLEGYFYNLLLKSVAFHHEDNLLSPANDSRTYFEECRMRELVRNTSDLEVHLESYAKYHLFNAQRRQALLASLLSKYEVPEGMDDDLDPDTATFGVNYGGLRDAPAAGEGRASRRRRPPAAATTSAIREALATKFAELDGSPYTAEQQVVVDAIKTRSSGLLVLTGGPGSGKTFMTKKLRRELRQAGKTVHLSASTGAAAVRLSRFTVTNHSAFDLPVSGRGLQSWALAQSELHPKSQVLRNTDVFIIDEFSMMTDVEVMLILTRLFHAGGCQCLEDALKHKLLILVGDHAQLPPVCKCQRHTAEADGFMLNVPQSICQDCHIASNPYLAPGRDPAACSPHYITPEMVPLLATADTTVICTHVADAKAHNHAFLAKLRSKGKVEEVHACPIQHDVPDGTPAVEALDLWLREERFRTMERVAVGARVVVLENCDLGKGAANGATGVVMDLRYKESREGQELVRAVLMRLDATGLQLWGGTLCGPTIIHARNVFSPGQMYVMLSHVTEWRHIKIVGRLTPADFIPVVLPGFEDLDALPTAPAPAGPAAGLVLAGGGQHGPAAAPAAPVQPLTALSLVDLMPLD